LLLFAAVANPGWSKEQPWESSATLSRDELYMELVSAYKPLSECVAPLMKSGRINMDEVAEALAASSEFVTFREEAIDILGHSDPWVMAVTPEKAPREQIKQLMLGLGDKASSQAPADRLKSARAIVLAMMQLARVSDGQCVPSQNLQYWKTRSDAADH
jgi:hypothetical protein